jgi:integrase
MKPLAGGLKYLHTYRDRHGKLRHAFRRRKFATVMLPGEPGSVELMQAYTNALAGVTASLPGEINDVRHNPRREILSGNAVAYKNKPGSVSAAVTLYLGSMDFGRLADATRGDRRRDLERFRADYGEQSFAALERKHVEMMLAAKASTPHAAKNFLKALRGVVSVALKAGIRETDPTSGIRVKAKTSPQGFQSWSESDIAQFEAAYPVGSRERLAFALLLYTGQRRGDVIKMGRQHVRTAV